jgi:hypothetical protein
VTEVCRKRRKVKPSRRELPIKMGMREKGGGQLCAQRQDMPSWMRDGRGSRR